MCIYMYTTIVYWWTANSLIGFYFCFIFVAHTTFNTLLVVSKNPKFDVLSIIS
jgi:hypothetical protein